MRALLVSTWLLVQALLPAGPAQASAELARCLEQRGLLRLARVLGPDGVPVWCMYVNRAQAVVSFGSAGKDNAIGIRG